MGIGAADRSTRADLPSGSSNCGLLEPPGSSCGEALRVGSNVLTQATDHHFG